MTLSLNCWPYVVFLPLSAEEDSAASLDTELAADVSDVSDVSLASDVSLVSEEVSVVSVLQ